MNRKVTHGCFLFSFLLLLSNQAAFSKEFLDESMIRIDVPILGKVCPPKFEFDIHGLEWASRNETYTFYNPFNRVNKVTVLYESFGINIIASLNEAVRTGNLRLSRDLAVIARHCPDSLIDLISKSLGAAVIKFGIVKFYDKNTALFDKVRKNIRIFFKSGPIPWENLQERPRIGSYAKFPRRFGEVVYGRYGLTPHKPRFSGLDLIVNFYSLGDNLLDLLPGSIGNTRIIDKHIPTNIANFRMDTDEAPLDHWYSMSNAVLRQRSFAKHVGDVVTHYGAFDFERFQKWIYHSDSRYVKAAILNVFLVHNKQNAASISKAMKRVFFSTFYHKSLRVLAFSNLYDVTSNRWGFVSRLFSRIKSIWDDKSLYQFQKTFYASFAYDLLDLKPSDSLKLRIETFIQENNILKRTDDTDQEESSSTQEEIDPEKILEVLSFRNTEVHIEKISETLKKLIDANIETFPEKEQIVSRLKEYVAHSNFILALLAGYNLAIRSETVDWLLKKSWDRHHETRVVARRALYDMVPPFYLKQIVKDEKRNAVWRLSHQNVMQAKKVVTDKWYVFDQLEISGEDRTSDFDDWYLVPYTHKRTGEFLIAGYTEEQAASLRNGNHEEPKLIMEPRFDPLAGRLEMIGWVQMKDQKRILIGHFDAEGDDEGVLIGSVYESPDGSVFKLTHGMHPLQIRLFLKRLEWVGRFELD